MISLGRTNKSQMNRNGGNLISTHSTATSLVGIFKWFSKYDNSKSNEDDSKCIKGKVIFTASLLKILKPH